VTAYLEDELEDRRATSFEQHTLVCEGCARYLDQMRATIRLVSDRDAPGPPARTDRNPIAGDVYAYKFLQLGAVGRFSQFEWPTDVWVSADGPARPCRRGIHACSVDDLPHWLDEELWVIELAEPVTAKVDKLLAPAGRLDRRIAEWDEDAARRLARDCLARIRDRAVESLRGAGLADESRRLAGMPEEILASEAEELAQRAGPARPACEYVAAAAVSLLEQPFAAAAGAAYVAALAAAQAGGMVAQRDERREQTAWLLRELGLARESRPLSGVDT
jgi:hypothetical protein